MYNVVNPFGPLIYQADIRGKFHDFLLEGVDVHRTSPSARKHLVGNIEEQRRAPYDVKKFIGFTDEHIINYMDEKHKWHNSIKRTCLTEEMPWDFSKSKIEYNLGPGPWINYQRDGEFNPMHNHSGIISAVIFIDIPNEIKKERDTSEYIGGAAGCLEFIFGNQHILIRPKSGYMYLFPASLWHLVYPYTSEVERVTMSFNVHQLSVDGQEVSDMTYFVNYTGKPNLA